MESSARGWWIWLSFASRAYPLAWPLEPQPGRGLGLTGFASRSMSLVPGSCSLHAARPRAPSLLLFKLGMRTSVAGILQASSASPGRGAVPAPSRLRAGGGRRRAALPIVTVWASNLWPSGFTRSRAVFKEKLEISLPRENLQMVVSCTGMCECYPAIPYFHFFFFFCTSCFGGKKEA